MQTPAPAASPRLGANLALLGISLLVGLALLELGVRLLIPVRNVGPSFTVYDPVYGKALKKSFQCRRITPEFTMTFSTNSLGFRGPEPTSFPAGGVLFLGDSFTMGYGVNDGQEYPALVANALNQGLGAGRVPVVNTGMGDNGNGRWIKLLHASGSTFQPRVVVLQFSSNDPDDNLIEGMFAIDKDGKLIEAPAPPPPSWRRRAQTLVEAIPGLTYSYAVALLRQDPSAQTSASAGAGTVPDRTEPSAVSPGERLTLRLLDEALSICQTQHWPALVISADAGDHQANLLRRGAEARGARFVAIPPKAQRPDLYYKVDGHWNAAGHAFAAEVVTKELLANPQMLAPLLP